MDRFGARRACRLPTRLPVNRAKGGRPRLDRREGFLSSLSEVLPHVYAEIMSWRRAAAMVGISPRSLKRYAEAMNGLHASDAYSEVIVRHRSHAMRSQDADRMDVES